MSKCGVPQEITRSSMVEKMAVHEWEHELCSDGLAFCKATYQGDPEPRCRGDQAAQFQ